MEIGNRNEEGRVCENFGNVCCSMGDFKLVIKWYKKLFDVVEEIGDKVIIGKVNCNFGNSYCYDGVFEYVIIYYSWDLSIV